MEKRLPGVSCQRGCRSKVGKVQVTVKIPPGASQRSAFTTWLFQEAVVGQVELNSQSINYHLFVFLMKTENVYLEGSGLLLLL
jgi:hypothetical protein